MTDALTGSPHTPRVPVTVLVLTQDEAVNIADCLHALTWTDDVVLVDSGSTDGTLERARAVRADVRVFEHPFTDFGEQRNWALDRTSPVHEWVLFLDADERSTPAFVDALKAAVDNPRDHVGFFLTCRNYFMDRWIKHCSLFPSWQLRLLKKGHVRFQKEGHGQREVSEGRLGYIHEPYDHFGFSKGIEAWCERHKVYAENETELIRRLREEPLHPGALCSADPVQRRRFLKGLAARLPGRPYFRWLYCYILRRGFLDGKPGWIFCKLRFEQEQRIASALTQIRAIRGK